MIEQSRATAIHESGHAVVSHLLGLPLMHVALLDDTQGETAPSCAFWPTCEHYYRNHDPSNFPHSLEIQHNFRWQAAVAVAGEIAELCVIGEGHRVKESEVLDDRKRAYHRASLIHYWRDKECLEKEWWWPDGHCSTCDDFISPLKSSVETIIKQAHIRDAILLLAEQLLKTPLKRLHGRVVKALLKNWIPNESQQDAKNSIPPAPERLARQN